MKKIALLLLLIYISGCATGYSVKEGPYKVTNVVDGDTLDIGNQRIRFSGINTPEVGECYYQEAKDKVKELALGKEVYLERDVDDMDKYDRLLRYIYVGNVSLNALLVEQGYAVVFDRYNATTKRYAEYKVLEQEAKSEMLGVWSCPKKQCEYIANKNSKSYYRPDCKWAKKIKPENQLCIKSEEEIPKGYKPGKGCPT